jgi:ABC transporter substrate binding protein
MKLIPSSRSLCAAEVEAPSARRCRAPARTSRRPRWCGSSLNRPGGNITGVTQLSSELLSKRLGLLHDLLPAVATIGFLLDPTYPGAESQARDLQDAARSLGLQVHVLNAGLEGPTFISRTVTHRRLDRRYLVTHDPQRSLSLEIPQRSSPSRTECAIVCAW